MRTVEWVSEKHGLKTIDQRVLPEKLIFVEYTDYREVADAIRDMVIRGAPVIGVSAAYGVAMAAFQSKASSKEQLLLDLAPALATLREARPTAVNLAWAVDHMASFAKAQAGSTDAIREALLVEAQRMADEDVETNLRISRHGAELIQDGDTIIHHCNTGALATVDWGTALGVIRMAHQQGKHIHVLVDETRPRLQGARLTAWELSQYGIPYDIISDNMSGHFLHSGAVQRVFFGGDRVAANGDVANKIGSYMLALAAHENHVPVYSVVPTSTVDLSLASGDLIPIEERSQSEVLDIQIAGERATPRGATARNPAFDVTPNRYLSGIITEKGVVYPPFVENLARAVHGQPPFDKE
jgi:methylthioribose-1-phosphate isomerase